MKKIKFITTLLSLLILSELYSQVPEPAPEQSKPIVLFGATAHIGNGEVIENSLIGFENGKLIFVVQAGLARIDLSNFVQIDVTGQHVYPGFILPNSQIGLIEVSSIQATIDNTEVSDFSPNVRTQIAYNTDSKLIPTLRYNGILLTECAPNGNRISGTSSVMNLEGWNWEDATFKKDIGIHLNWPLRLTNDFNELSYRYEKVKNKNYEASMQELRSFFEECTSYNAEKTKNKNLKLEAMQGLFSGEKILFIHADGTKEIIESIKFAQEFNVQKIAMIAGTGSIDAASFLAENNIPVIMQNVHSLPNTQDMEYDLPYRLASILNDAGVQVSLSYTSLSSCRNLPFFAGTAVAYGVDYETAIQMITLNTAKALGIDDEVGSIVEGKRATLFVSKGDALNMMTNAVTYAFIDGKMIDLQGEQQLLYERYAKKYTEEEIEIESE